ncbi:MAG: ECF transporter S component [Oscillospiraceae bacterium]|nr:ECF transporter S component [Oscillospiraceae bacterium]
MNKIKLAPPTVKISLAALLLAFGLLLPQAFHLFGQQAGQWFLPMHLGVFAAGFLLGPIYGCAIGLLTPLLSFVLMGMPPAPLLWFMTAELAFYGLSSGLFYRKLRLPVWAALPLAQLSGRAAELLLLLLMGALLAPGRVLPYTLVFTAAVTGLPGIALQWAALPLIVKLTEKKGIFQSNG